jgi:hypothetical protein
VNQEQPISVEPTPIPLPAPTASNGPTAPAALPSAPTLKSMNVFANDDEETRIYVGRDIVLARRILARITFENTVHGYARIPSAATPLSRISLRSANGMELGYLDAALLDAIIREESLRARDIASKS